MEFVSLSFAKCRIGIKRWKERYTMIPKTWISVSNGFRYASEACLVNMGCLKTIYISVRMSQEEFGRLESFSYPDGSGRNFEDIFISRFYGCLFLYRNLLETILNNILNTFMYLGNKVRKTQPPKIVGKLLEHTNGASTGKSGSITNKTTLSNWKSRKIYSI